MEQLIPKLRFPEFKGEWEKKRLGELFAEFKSGKSITSKDIYEFGKYPVFGGNGLRGFTNIFTHDADFFLIGRQGALCGNINEFKGKAFVSEHAIVCIANNKNYTEFLKHKLEYVNLNRLSESSAQPGLAVNKLLRFKITIPSLPEQQKIADYLSTIDRKLELLRQKKEQLECYKKGMMQQLFSQQVRFKDDNGNNYPEWQEKRLGDVLYKGTSVKCTSISEEKILTVRLHQKGVVKSSNTQNLSIGATTYFIRTKGQFIYGKQNIFNGAFGIIPDCYDGFLTSADIPALTINKKYLNAFFLVSFLRSNNRYKRIENVAIGTGSKRVHENEFLKLKINLPSLPEQKKIADFLSALDNKIEGVGNQIEQTEAFKKAMLQQLFV